MKGACIQEKVKNSAAGLPWLLFMALVGFLCVSLSSCAGQRQEVVCDEIEYRYNSMSYSPDQRTFMEEELRACREEEAKKKQASAETRQSIYARFAAQDTTKKVHTAADSASDVVTRADSVASVTVDSAAVPGNSAVAATDSTVAPVDSAAAPVATEEAPQ